MRNAISVCLLGMMAMTSLLAEAAPPGIVPRSDLVAPARLSAASEARNRSRWRMRWWSSVAILGAANLADILSSRGRAETNSLLQSPQGGINISNGVLVKSSATGGFLLLQALLKKKSPQAGLEKPFTIINVLAAGAVAGTSLHNSSIPTSSSSR